MTSQSCYSNIHFWDVRKSQFSKFTFSRPFKLIHLIRNVKIKKILPKIHTVRLSEPTTYSLNRLNETITNVKHHIKYLNSFNANVTYQMILVFLVLLVFFQLIESRTVVYDLEMNHFCSLLNGREYNVLKTITFCQNYDDWTLERNPI